LWRGIRLCEERLYIKDLGDKVKLVENVRVAKVGGWLFFLHQGLIEVHGISVW
jgi:hypothetical protein